MKRRAFLAAAAGALVAPGLARGQADAGPAQPGGPVARRPEFVHLHVHSWYSRDGVPSPERIVRKARALGFPAVALTDHGSLFGILDFHAAAHGEGIRPILGCELYVESGDACAGPVSSAALDRVTVLAEDATGYRNLLAMVSSALSARWRRPLRVTLEGLASHAAGLIAFSGGGSSALSRCLASGDEAHARALAGRYRDIFGAASFFVELCPGDLDAEAPSVASRVALARGIGAPLVATGDVHYLEPEDVLTCEVLLRRRRAGVLGAACHRRVPAQGLHMRSAHEMVAAFAGIPEACRNTVTIAERCRVTLPLGGRQWPEGEVAARASARDDLRKLALAGLRERYGDAAGSAAGERLAHELTVVDRLGLADYFLAARQILVDARQAGIPLNAGRGAALGSVLLHCLGVTPVDPLRFGLLFERFLDGREGAWPDLRLEFPDSHRDRVLAALAAPPGPTRAVSLTNFARLGPWAALHRVARALGHEADADAMILMVGEGAWRLSLDEALRQSAALRAHVAADARVAQLYDCARALAGRPLHPFIATPVLFPRAPSLEGCVPLYRRAGRPEPVAACEWRHAERVGYALDLVPTGVTSRVDQAAARLAARGITVDLEAIPLDDAATYAFLSRGRTRGIPGFESQEAREALRALRPDRFEDIVALLALSRSGASHLLPDLVARKHGRRPPSEVHPVVDGLTRETYGLILYQEQVMQIATGLAGVTALEAERFRQAVGTRGREAFRGYRPGFLVGCASRGVADADARRVWDLLEAAAHIVLKACLVPNALAAYRAAYVKARWPRAFAVRAHARTSGGAR